MANSDSSLIDAKYKQNIDERIETAKTLKNEGNEFYKEKKYRQATGKYHRALLQLKLNMDNVCRPFTDGLQRAPNSFPSYNIPVDYRQTISAIQADCYNNLAGSYLYYLLIDI